MTPNEIYLFSEIFVGNTEAYGQHTPEEGLVKEGEKSKGKNWTVRKKIELSQYEKHIQGETGLGIVPLDVENKVRFIVIDIDNYNVNYVHNIVRLIYIYNLPFLPFRSKSGGLHLYLFFKDKVDYGKIQEKIVEFYPVLSLKNTVELFPKQRTIKNDTVGNWINLPYYKGVEAVNYLYDENCNKVDISTALTIIKEKSLTLDQFLSIVENLYYNDAPPCLQAIYYQRDTAQRNDYLFNFAIYCKTKYGEEFENELFKINEELERPLESNEIENTIIKSHKKKDYCYKCTTLPLSDCCLKEICKNRLYGLDSDEISGLSFEDFIQYTSDPPYYEWIINGRPLTFYSEADIIAQYKFRELCFRELHILPNMLKQKTWTNIINRALKNMTVKKIAIEDDISPGALWLNNLYEFLENRIPAENKQQILIDRVYKVTDKQVYLFKSKNLIDFLFNQKSFRYFGTTEIHSRLKRLGGKDERMYIDKYNTSVRLWSLPFKCMENFKTSIEDLKIDFTKGEQNEETMY